MSDTNTEAVTPKGKKKADPKSEPLTALGPTVDTEAPTVASILSDPELAAVQPIEVYAPPVYTPPKPRMVISDEPIAVEAVPDPGPKLSKRTLAEIEAGRESLKSY